MSKSLLCLFLSSLILTTATTEAHMHYYMKFIKRRLTTQGCGFCWLQNGSYYFRLIPFPNCLCGPMKIDEWHSTWQFSHIPVSNFLTVDSGWYVSGSSIAFLFRLLATVEADSVFTRGSCTVSSADLSLHDATLSDSFLPSFDDEHFT